MLLDYSSTEALMAHIQLFWRSMSWHDPAKFSAYEMALSKSWGVFEVIANYPHKLRLDNWWWFSSFGNKPVPNHARIRQQEHLGISFWNTSYDGIASEKLPWTMTDFLIAIKIHTIHLPHFWVIRWQWKDEESPPLYGVEKFCQSETAPIRMYYRHMHVQFLWEVYHRKRASRPGRLPWMDHGMIRLTSQWSA